MTFGGGTALAVAYLHHRISEDVDLFSLREVEQQEVQPLARALASAKLEVDQQVAGPRRILVLSRRGKEIGHVDIAYYPFDPIERTTRWGGLRVDSLLDMTVNKVQAVLTRFRPRDFVDLHFLLREGPERDLQRLLGFVRTKFGVGADPLTLAERLLLVREIQELPRLLRPVTKENLVREFEATARILIRKS